MKVLLQTIMTLLLSDLSGQAIQGVSTSAEATSMQHQGMVLWTYHHAPSEGKPYFHPLRTTSGTLLTELRPEDHPWHRGLWFSWKYINGLNYWEENHRTGLSEGSTRIVATHHRVEHNEAITIEQSLEYAPGPSAAAVLAESRTLVLSTPDTSGRYTIEWTSTFRALENVELGRTPIIGEPGGKAYGGYAGLSLRINKLLSEGIFLTRAGKFDASVFDRINAKWMIFESGEEGSVLIMHHPNNLSSSTTWYVAPAMPYFSPALLYDAPLQLAEDETLSLRYHILVSPKQLSLDDADHLYLQWTAMTGS